MYEGRQLTRVPCLLSNFSQETDVMVKFKDVAGMDEAKQVRPRCAPSSPRVNML